MTFRQKWRRIRGVTIATFLCFWTLIALGVWQLHRLTWKEGILADLHTAALAPPVALPANPTPFEKVFATGTWLPGKAALYGDEVHDTPAGPVEGGEIIVPLRRADNSVLLVDLGWIAGRTPTIPTNLPATPTGYLHAPIAPGWFAGADDPAHGLFYTLDPARIAAGLGLGPVLPEILICLGPLPPPGSAAPQPAQALPTPPNNHYQYALEWFGFALVLLFEYAFFVRKRLLE